MNRKENNRPQEEAAPVNLLLLVGEIGGMFLIFALTLFLSAGTIAWLAGWAFLVLFFGFVIALTLWLFRHNPGLLTERMTGIGKTDQKNWDKLFYLVANIFFLAWLILMSLEAVRFHWSHMPGWLQVAGGGILLFSFRLFFLVFRENPYLSPAVRIQKERGQRLIATGPYHYVRHPMYAAIIPFGLGTTLLLGSWYGIALGSVLILMLACRAVMEEKVLKAELEGYAAYMTEVKHRFIPWIW